MEVELSCMVCGKDFMGPEPVMCCSGRDCGCMGMPTEPIVCSQWCYDHLPAFVDQKALDSWKQSEVSVAGKHVFIAGYKAAIESEISDRRPQPEGKGKEGA